MAFVEKHTRRKLISEKIFELYYERGLRFDDIYKGGEQFTEFWKSFCLNTNSDKRKKIVYTYEVMFDPAFYEAVKNDFFQKLKSIQGNKRYLARIAELKEHKKMGNGVLDRSNEIVVSTINEEVVFDDDGRELVKTKTQEVKKMKIERIEFASDITLAAYKLATDVQEFSNEYFDDLCRAAKGEQTKKFQFKHLEIAGKFKMVALELADQMEDLILNGSATQIADVKMRINMANKYAEMMDNVKRAELAPLYHIKSIHEAGLMRQQELQGTISNDRLLLDSGNIHVKREDTLVQDREKIRSELKDKGYVGIEEMMLKNILNVGGIVNEGIQQIESEPVEEVEEE